MAKLYERYGARLLEQNVRSFLQFTGKINKGIRDTIRNEPHMFLAFNNGIAATADHIELDETSKGKSCFDFAKCSRKSCPTKNNAGKAVFLSILFLSLSRHKNTIKFSAYLFLLRY